MRNIEKLHWIKQVSEFEYDMFIDNHMLSTWRMCQANFELLHIEGRRLKNMNIWPLEFGSLLHLMIENIYKWKQNNEFTLEKVSEEAYHLWDEKRMDRFLQHRTCKSLGGKIGFIALCHQYAQFYNQDNERLRIIGTEIGFGSNKEVPLGTMMYQISDFQLIKLNCYLSGRIDFLADDGLKIGPVDHKTRASFGIQDLGATYNPNEGMSGYIFATRYILKSQFPEIAAKKQVNSAWMNFIQVSHETDPMKRFRRVLLMRTDYQLEQYRLRQLESFKDIFNFLYLNRQPVWNTEVCAHWYGGECLYRPVHRQSDPQSQLVVLNNDYTINDYWNPEKEELDKNGNGDTNGVKESSSSNSNELSGDSKSYETAV
jgi:hypothetical protein